MAEALAIAQNSECTEKGTLPGTGTYNDATNAWWLDFMPKQELVQNGCSPQCVVTAALSAASIDWRCTGLGGMASKDDLINVTSPRIDAVVQNPLSVTGEARGNWYFEASFPIKIYDSAGTLLGVTPAQAQGDWMTSEYVPFSALFTYKTPTTVTGYLVFEKDNPSGLPENANELRIPVTFGATTTVPVQTDAGTQIKLFYYNPALDQGPGGAQCSSVGLVAVERVISNSTTPLRDAIQLLLRGELTEEERSQGVTTEFPLAKVTLKSATLVNGAATLTFLDPQNKTGGGSCRVAILMAQIEATAKQFPTVDSVRILPETLFQP